MNGVILATFILVSNHPIPLTLFPTKAETPDCAAWCRTWLEIGLTESSKIPKTDQGRGQ